MLFTKPERITTIFTLTNANEEYLNCTRIMAHMSASLTLLAVEARPKDAVAAANSHPDQEGFGDEVGATTEEIFRCLRKYATETQLELDLPMTLTL